MAGSVVILALAAGSLTACGDAGATITRLTVGTPGPEPYMLMADTDEMDLKERPRAGGTQAGDAPGLYGGTRRASSCDRRKLIEFLRAEPDKARAWASAQGIEAGEIPAYVSGLTPVLLRTDTLVTNHGYRDGAATSGPAVLQAGMGVLVNDRGVPRVKCNCGNPLTRPGKEISPKNASYTGRSWPGFTERKVTRIQPREPEKGKIDAFVLVDPEGTMGFERPQATWGGSDGPPTALPPAETEPPGGGSPSPDGSGLQSPGTPPPGTGSPDPASPGAQSPGPDPSGSPGGGTGTGQPGSEPPAPPSNQAPPGPQERASRLEPSGGWTHGPPLLPPAGAAPLRPAPAPS